MIIRTGAPADGEAISAISAICGPAVENTSIAFKPTTPAVDKMRSRTMKTLDELPWLVGRMLRGL